MARVEQLFDHHSSLIYHEGVGKRNSVLGMTLWHVGVVDAEFADDRAVDVREKGVGDAKFLRKPLENLN